MWRKSTTREFEIGGFAQIGTGERDYGMGVLRIDQTFLAGNPVAAGWERHALLRLRVKGKAGAGDVYGVLRAIHPAQLPESREVPLLCLEYDDRLQLGVEKGDRVSVSLSEAGFWGRYKYFRDHPNIVVRSYARYTAITGVFTGLLGAMIWALKQFLGM